MYSIVLWHKRYQFVTYLQQSLAFGIAVFSLVGCDR